MPTVLTYAGFAVRVYTNDHVPMHVHVIKARREVVIDLGDASSAPCVRENFGMRKNLERKALRLVAVNQEYLIKRWRQIHG